MNQSTIDIILIEDDQNDYEITARVLKRRGLAGTIVWLQDGEKALEHLTALAGRMKGEVKRQPRLVILDIKLPKVLGFDVLQYIKQDEWLQHLPVVIFSSSNQERDIVRAGQLHANSYVVKPVDYDSYAHAIDVIVTYWIFTHKYL
ncbi:MAG: response regulator [Bacteroidetes bacterium]|nr:MAG: response regulator [Bacteroidota bacterium]